MMTALCHRPPAVRHLHAGGPRAVGAALLRARGRRRLPHQYAEQCRNAHKHRAHATAEAERGNTVCRAGREMG